jgi:AraC-like DNA-binding protein
MDGSDCSPYPHYSWLAHWLAVAAPHVFDVHQCRHVTHHLLLAVSGDADILWETCGTGTAFHAAAGAIGFFPGDQRMHSLAMTTVGGFAAYDVLIPEWHVRRVCDSEGLPEFKDFQAIPHFRDALIEASLLRLATRTEGRQLSEDIGDEIAARQIVLRLCAFVGGRTPDWRNDTSVFTPIVMRQVVACIDAHLGIPLSVESLAKTVSLSPGHFARKFHHSAGESLGRFANRRRIGTSFAMLRAGSSPLSRIALDLGFSSQSHFSRLFSHHTGITPLQFRRLHLRMND